MASDHTPDSYIKGRLRQLWVSSRERSAALKNTGYCCAKCGVKQSRKKGFEVKLDVHHLHEGKKDIHWQRILDVIREELLCPPDRLMPLCKECHDKITYG